MNRHLPPGALAEVDQLQADTVALLRLSRQSLFELRVVDGSYPPEWVVTALVEAAGIIADTEDGADFDAIVTHVQEARRARS